MKRAITTAAGGHLALEEYRRHLRETVPPVLTSKAASLSSPPAGHSAPQLLGRGQGRSPAGTPVTGRSIRSSLGPGPAQVPEPERTSGEGAQAAPPVVHPVTPGDGPEQPTRDDVLDLGEDLRHAAARRPRPAPATPLEVQAVLALARGARTALRRRKPPRSLLSARLRFRGVFGRDASPELETDLALSVAGPGVPAKVLACCRGGQ